MSEHPDFLLWWGIGMAVVIFIGVMGTLILSVRSQCKEERRTHRRTRETGRKDG